MVEGEWIHMKISVHGTTAALYLGGSLQSCLLINDLKLGDAQGAIALWGGSGTVGYFANLNIVKGSEPPQFRRQTFCMGASAAAQSTSAGDEQESPALPTGRLWHRDSKGGSTTWQSMRSQ
jgi:hypothetical protein